MACATLMVSGNINYEHCIKMLKNYYNNEVTVMETLSCKLLLDKVLICLDFRCHKYEFMRFGKVRTLTVSYKLYCSIRSVSQRPFLSQNVLHEIYILNLQSYLSVENPHLMSSLGGEDGWNKQIYVFIFFFLFYFFFLSLIQICY